MGKPLKNEVGNRYGHWLVISRAPNAGPGAAWYSKCKCGAVHAVAGGSLRSGASKQCTKCNVSSKNTTHGMSKTAIYEVWCSVIARTENPKSQAFANYGGRGITMCDEWRNSFAQFYADMGDPPTGKSLERLDNDEGYSKGNCVWASRSAQARNKRTSVKITHRGVTMCVADWAKVVNISPQTIYYRISEGLTNPALLLTKGRIAHNYQDLVTN